MYEIRTVLSLCFLSIAVVFNIYTTVYIGNIDGEKRIKNNLYLISIPILIHCFFIFLAILVWQHLPFLDKGAPFILIYGPLLWHGILIMKNENHHAKNMLWHFLPFFIFLSGFVYGLSAPNQKLLYYFKRVLYLTGEAQIVIYLIAALFTFRKLKNGKASTYHLKKEFLNYVMLLGCLSVLVFIIASIDSIVHSGPDTNDASYLVHFFMLGITLIAHWSIVQHGRTGVKTVEKFNAPIWTPALTNEKIKSIKRDTISSHSHEHLSGIAQKLNHLPLEVFKNNSLGLARLSELIGEPTHLVTQTFSIKLETNFSKYVNEKRLKVAEELLKKGDLKSSISEIAYYAGFNSEASFYRVFKDHFGTTPRNFQKKYRPEY